MIIIGSDAMKEFQPSLRRAADNLRRAYSLRAAVCHSVETKQRPVAWLRIWGFLFPRNQEFGQQRMEQHRTL